MTEREDDVLRLLITIREAAEHLEGFTFESNNGLPALVAEDGRRLTFRMEWNAPDRVTVWGGYPQAAHKVTQTPHHKITAAIGRGGEVLAREITRRLLPGYTEDFARVVAATKVAEGHAEEGRKLAEELAGLLRAEARNEGDESVIHVYGDASPRITVSGDYVRWDRLTSSDRTLNLAIAKLIGDHNTAHREGS